MTGQTSIENQTVTIAAGSVHKFHGTFDSVNVHSASGAIRVKFGAGTWTDWGGAREYIPPESFQDFAVQNPGASPVTVEFTAGNGRVRDYSVRIENTQLTTREAVPDVLTHTSVSALANATTELAAANPLRREILIVNLDAATTVFVSGNAAAGVGEGTPVLPGQSLIWQNSAAMYARNDSGAPVAVSVALSEWSA